MSDVASLDDACPPGEHELVRVGYWTECKKCGLSSQSIHWIETDRRRG